jgi:hypothetical protein
MTIVLFASYKETALEGPVADFTICPEFKSMSLNEWNLQQM